MKLQVFHIHYKSSYIYKLFANEITKKCSHFDQDRQNAHLNNVNKRQNAFPLFWATRYLSIGEGFPGR